MPFGRLEHIRLTLVRSHENVICVLNSFTNLRQPTDAVQRISDQRMPHRGHMDPDLMRSPRQNLHLKPEAIRKRLDHLHPNDCKERKHAVEIRFGQGLSMLKEGSD